MNKPKRTLAAKLNQLYASHPRPDGKEWSNDQVADAIVKSGIVKSFSNSYMWQLRNGVKDNPTMRHLAGLAWYFGVPGDYFFDDDVAAAIDAKIAVASSEPGQPATDPEIRLLAMRAGELSPARRKQALEMLSVVYELDRREQEGSAQTSPEDPQHRTMG
ncbi:hypothetical protein [Amycolatopsis saalfeldensis]|uniref:XRE family transcriptional regulator n=1 Tax=Amycolatopsis saalfeldensis TaxID=394193 RepID=A0A1H8YQD4_9PSEU|nr:hypothetical protein [Amycolatopsis saalfeldensis]SEP53578.1 hypothetical protein SAMN04489732_1293 [Amycolatopsis saalfeldensis]